MPGAQTHEARNGWAAVQRPVPTSPTAPGQLGLAPSARPSRWRPLRRAITPRVVAGLVVMATSFGGYLGWLLVSTPPSSELVVLARDVDAGAALSRDDLTSIAVQLPDSAGPAAIPAAELDRAVGRRLVGPAFRGQLLVRQQLATTDQAELLPGQEATTVAVRPDTASSGALQRDDLVRVVVTMNKGRPDASSRTVLPSARVLTIGRGDQRPSTGTGLPGGLAAGATTGSGTAAAPRQAQPISTVTLSVPSEQVEALLAAKWAGEIDLVRLGPSRGQDASASGAGR